MEEIYCCGNCVFWFQIKNKEGEILDAGECKRFPPTVFPIPVQQIIGTEPKAGQLKMQPIMNAKDYCGEYHPRPEFNNIN